MVNVRTKGQNGEREFLAKLSELLGLDEKLTRNLQQTRCGGADCTTLPGYAIEIKNQKTLTLPDWWKQTITQAKTLKSVPILAYKVPRRGWMVCLTMRWLCAVGAQYPDDVRDLVTMSLDNFATIYKLKAQNNNLKGVLEEDFDPYSLVQIRERSLTYNGKSVE